MTWTNPDPTEFETGDILTEPNIGTYLLDNLLALPHPINLVTSTTDVTNTTAETTLYSVSVPANALGTNGMLMCMIFGDYLRNTGAVNLQLRVKFGGTQIFSDDIDWGGTTSANRQPWMLKTYLANMGATNVQRFWAEWNSANPGTVAPTTGLGDIDDATYRVGLVSGNGTHAIDTTLNQSFVFTAEWGSASASLSIRMFWARALLGRN